MRTRARTAWRRSLLGWMVLVALGGPAATAVPAATLRWKLKPGETLRYVMEQMTETSDKAGAQESKVTLSQTINWGWAVKEVGPDGVADLNLTIDRIRTKIASPIGVFAYDSDDKQEPQGLIAAGLVPFLKALVGAPFTVKMSPQGELSDVKIPERLLQAIREAGPAGGGGANIFSEEGLRSMITEVSLALPKEDLGKGKSWTRRIKIPSPFGDTTVEKVYTYQGPDPSAGPDVERIDLETKVETPPPPEGAAFKINALERKGTFFFDNAAGRLARSQLAETMEAVLTINKIEITQRNNATTTMKLESDGASK